MSFPLRRSEDSGGQGRSSWKPPDEFDEYRLLRPIGSGRTGHVYVAQDTLLERTVAVKFIPALDSSSLARFLVEARAAARIQHPNVATLYRVGQVDDRGYLVSELVEGMGLDRIEKPIEPSKAVALAIDLARGLSAAHRVGVLHRDIKPGNAMVTASGRVKLVDFGLAKLVARPDEPDPGIGGSPIELPDLSHGTRIGTPYYMAPEAWNGDEATQRTDLYSLGAVLYELLAGKAPFRRVPMEHLPVVLQERDAPPVSSAAPGLDRRISGIVDRCLRRDPAARFRSADDLLDALLELRENAAPISVPEGNPYRGLRPFEAEHRALFFGRRREVRGAVERLRTEGFVLVTGDSGAGKSSLCLAGVIPEIAGGGLGDGRIWREIRWVPGWRPRLALAAALGALPGITEQDIDRILLGEDPKSLGRTVRAAIPRDHGLLVYVDQLEELVTLGDPAQAAQVGIALAELGGGLPGVRLLATARSDFLTRLAGLPGLGEAVPRALHLLGPMTREGTREAVVGPARIKGFRFESDAFVESLAGSTEGAEGGLPLLQFALAELWELRDERGRMVPASALEELGGVAGALARHADNLLGQMLPEQRGAARRILLRLITVDGTRARREESELLAGQGSRGSLESLVRGRLVVAREMEGGTVYEIAHEALLEGWGTLARWLAEAAEGREVQSRLESAAREWTRGGKRADALWSPRQVGETSVLDPVELTAGETSFLSASRAAERGRRRIRWWAAGGIAVLLAAVAGGVRIHGARERSAEFEARKTEAMSAGRAASMADAELLAARADAWRLFGAGDRRGGELAWAGALDAGTRADRAYSEAGDAFERLLGVGKNRTDAHRRFGDFLLERAMRADREGYSGMRDLLVQRLAHHDPDGERMRLWMEPSTVAFAVDPPGATIEVFRYEPDGRGGRDATPVPFSARFLPGSYLFVAAAPGREEVRFPVLLDRGEHEEIVLRLPEAGSVPEGFAYVPAGRFLFGSSGDEGLRQYYNAAPMHPVETGEYLIARHETTFGQWLEYLEDLAPAERARRTPSVASTGFHGRLLLGRRNAGWFISLQPSGREYRARAGERIRYAKRDQLLEQDWLRFPVAGVTAGDAAAYADWLSRSGRVPGARLCTEYEWERAARGADGRTFPHGDRLDPGDANFDETYGKDPLGFGPDEVGSHPRSRSPFGLDDMSGNVWEWVTSSPEPGETVARGGSYYFSSSTARVMNRELPEPTLRDLTVGFRLCAPVLAR